MTLTFRFQDARAIVLPSFREYGPARKCRARLTRGGGNARPRAEITSSWRALTSSEVEDVGPVRVGHCERLSMRQSGAGRARPSRLTFTDLTDTAHNHSPSSPRGEIIKQSRTTRQRREPRHKKPPLACVHECRPCVRISLFLLLSLFLSSTELARRRRSSTGKIVSMYARPSLPLLASSGGRESTSGGFVASEEVRVHLWRNGVNSRNETR